MTATRRQFLHTALAAGTGLALGTTPATAIEPIRRTGKSHLRLSLAAYSYRDLLGGMNPKLTMADFVSDCAKFGLEGTELTSYYFPKNLTHDYLPG